MGPVRQSLICFSSLLSTAVAFPYYKRVDNSTGIQNATFDYVIVGGGLTGLVVANRLSENPAHTVLVIENGEINNDPATLIPQSANSNNNALMYDIQSAPEAQLGNASFLVTVGNVVGGGSVVNGMAFDRAAAADYDAWEKLGNEGWGWESLLHYFKKSTTWTPPMDSLIEEFNITFDASFYGTDGPLQASMPNFEYPDTKTIWDSFRKENVPLPIEHASGNAVGGFWIPTALEPKTQTRSHARNAYYDPIQTRSNLHLVTGHKVNEILFDGLSAKGVQFTASSSNVTSKVWAKKEVILAAGAVFTPQLLQLSGIGPKNVLEAAGVEVKKDFPAVGAGLQDHPTAFMIFDLKNLSFPNPNSLAENATFNATAWEEYVVNKTGPYTNAHGNSLAFLALKHISNNSQTIVNEVTSQTSQDFLPAAYADENLLRGYEAQKAILAEMLSGEDAAVGEFPMGPSGFAVNALQRPFSRGSVTLDAANKNGNPVVHFNSFQNPIDKKLMLTMIQWTRRHWKNEVLSVFSPTELVPGAAAQSDEEILNALIGGGLLMPSFAHMSGTCSMLPENFGGVVGSDLLVYGVENLSVVDASILPLIPATHIQATMYAVGEKAADLIKARA
ncbi:GMC oxidoreductase [Aaosphaeria arxii CBS 175.79]|uniref:GMC oxidoreductase n=1 Tax=Aaosphaeria arxii CBS 175.79 TaxID=1450172 RepID=A0A6A5XU58_9PLEO|nr:GMC oxidoreductase [Aaosphaeria arxii CBS 175.79]KAF2016190.1 GMC oxidoreductase [Aaosphaeria arxii CBS 175.79]